jgi:hypothetical protein
MTREEFEEEYVNRHMRYDPRNIESKKASVERLRAEDGYTDTHIDLCWKVQKAKNRTGVFDRFGLITEMEW